MSISDIFIIIRDGKDHFSIASLGVNYGSDRDCVILHICMNGIRATQ